MIIDNKLNPIVIRKVREDFGWMSNMSNHSVVYQEESYSTTESLFQALRFKSIDREDIAEKIRLENNPMKSKMIAKTHYELLINNNYQMYNSHSLDIPHMKLCLELKVNAYPELLSLLSLTQDRAIIEDCSKRASLSGLFWGMKFDETFNLWIGENMLGVLWQELRSTLSDFTHTQQIKLFA